MPIGLGEPIYGKLDADSVQASGITTATLDVTDRLNILGTSTTVIGSIARPLTSGFVLYSIISE